MQRFAPKLIAALDRAIGFCQSTLAYGRAVERPPERRRVLLAPMVEDLRDLLGLWDETDDRARQRTPADLWSTPIPSSSAACCSTSAATRSQVLARAEPGRERPITVSARREGAAVVIDISDTGPGVPRAARDRLFKAFQGSTRQGGSGLGLAIAAELVHGHGGTIALAAHQEGSVFRIVIPDAGRRAATRESARQYPYALAGDWSSSGTATLLTEGKFRFLGSGTRAVASVTFKRPEWRAASGQGGRG